MHRNILNLCIYNTQIDHLPISMTVRDFAFSYILHMYYIFLYSMHRAGFWVDREQMLLLLNSERALYFIIPFKFLFY